MSVIFPFLYEKYILNETNIIKFIYKYNENYGLCEFKSEFNNIYLLNYNNIYYTILNAPEIANLKLLLAHQPNCAFTSAKLNYYEVQLSGHTHGGQMWPGTWLVRFVQYFNPGLTLYEKMWV